MKAHVATAPSTPARELALAGGATARAHGLLPRAARPHPRRALARESALAPRRVVCSGASKPSSAPAAPKPPKKPEVLKPKAPSRDVVEAAVAPPADRADGEGDGEGDLSAAIMTPLEQKYFYEQKNSEPASRVSVSNVELTSEEKAFSDDAGACRSMEQCVSLVEAQAQGGGLSDSMAAIALVQMSRLAEQSRLVRDWSKTALAERSLPLLAGRIRGRCAECDPRTLSMAILALAKLQAVDQKLFREAAAALSERCAQLSAKGLANTAYAFALAGIRDEGLLAALAEEALPRAREFSPQALAITAFAYATLRTAAPELMDAIGRRCVREAGNFTPQEIANTLWAFARMGQKLPTMLEGFADQVMWRQNEFQVPELVSIAYAYARLDYEIYEMMEGIAGRALSNMQSFSLREVSTLAWAFARLGNKNPQLFDCMLDRVLSEDPAAMDTPSWAGVLWAFATVGRPSEELFWAGAEQLAGDCSLLQPRDLSNTAWAVARVQLWYPDLMEALAAEAATKAAFFQPVEVRDFVQSFAKLNYQAPAALDALADKAAADLPRYNDRLVTDIASSYASLGYFHGPLFSATEAEVLARISDIPLVGLIHANWALASPGMPEEARGTPGFFDAVNDEILTRRKKVKLDQLCKLLLRQALVGHRCEALCDRVAEAASAKPNQLDQYALSGAAYAFAALEYDTAPSIFPLFQSRALKLAPKLRPQAVVSLATGFAAAGQASPELFSALQAQAVGNISNFSAAQLAEAMEAFALADQSCNELAVAVKSALEGEVLRCQQVSDQGDVAGNDSDLSEECAWFPTYDQEELCLLLDVVAASSDTRAGYDAVEVAVQKLLNLYPSEATLVSAVVST